MTNPKAGQPDMGAQRYTPYLMPNGRIKDPGMTHDDNGMWVRLSDYTALQSQLEAAERERNEARQIVRDIHWMALRYADGRKSYAVGMCNDAVRKGYEGGWLERKAQGGDPITPEYARDGMDTALQPQEGSR